MSLYKHDVAISLESDGTFKSCIYIIHEVLVIIIIIIIIN